MLNVLQFSLPLRQVVSRMPLLKMFLELRKHWTDDQVVEIVGVISLFGFLNRWNDTFATPLEHEPLEFAQQHLASKGWNGEKHIR